MTPEDVAQLALREADARNKMRSVRLFHPETYRQSDERFLAAVTVAAMQLVRDAGGSPAPPESQPAQKTARVRTTK
jgi:hypothetical protein